MWLLNLHMRGSVSRNVILSLKCRYSYLKGGILDYWKIFIFLVLYSLILSKGIKVYRIEYVHMK